MAKQLDRQLAEAQQVSADLAALIAGEREKIEKLRATASRSLADADLATLPTVAAEQAAAETELAARQKVVTELQRRAEIQRATVARIERAIRLEGIVGRIQAATTEAEGIFVELAPLAQRLRALVRMEDEIRAEGNITFAFFNRDLCEMLEHAATVNLRNPSPSEVGRGAVDQIYAGLQGAGG